MANIKSQIKRNRQNDKRRLRNRVYRGEARLAVKEARTSIEGGVPESKAAILKAISALDKAAEQGVIHKNNASRRKSRLMKVYNQMGPVQAIAEPVQAELGLEAQPAEVSPKGRRKAAPAKAAARKKVAEPKAEAPVETKAEPRKTAPRKTTTTAAKAKKPAASSTKGKKPASRSSTSGKKKTTAKKG